MSPDMLPAILEVVSLAVTFILSVVAVYLIRRVPFDTRPIFAATEVTNFAIDKLRVAEEKLKEQERMIAMLHAEIESLNGRLLLMQDNVDSNGQFVGGLSILAIWPNTKELNIQPERRAIYNSGFEYYPLYDDQATRGHIIDALRTNKFNVLEIGAHGMDRGIVLYNGDVAEPGWWSRIFRQYPVELVVLLSCQSIEVGRSILNAGADYVIVTTQDIDDDVAGRFATMFYRSLSFGLDVEDAYNDARLTVSMDQSEYIILLRQDQRL